MSLTATEIKIAVQNINKTLCPCIVRKALSPAMLDKILLETRTTGQNHYLQIVLSYGQSRFGRIIKKPKNAEIPHPFVMLLRKHIIGAIIEKIEQLGDDRVIAIFLTRKNDPTNNLVLLCELTGRQGNVFLLNSQNIILGSFYQNRSHKRLLVPSKKYIAPQLNKLSQINSSRFGNDIDVEQKIELHYTKLELQNKDDQQRNGVARIARLANKRLGKLLINLEKDLEKAALANELQNRAYLLQANLKQVKRGMTSLKVTDFNGSTVTILLDPSRDPVDYMQTLFKKAKRLRRATPQIDDRYLKTLEKKDHIDVLNQKIITANSENLEEILCELTKLFPDLKHQAAPKKERTIVRLPYRQYDIHAGRIARVGKSSADNDTLTLKHSSPGDLWLHVRSMTGSHVVVPMGRGEEPSQDILIDAAHLAAYFSKARGNDDVEIIYTSRKYVQKPKGSAPGSVRLLREKSLFLRVDQRRLKQLLDKN